MLGVAASDISEKQEVFLGYIHIKFNHHFFELKMTPTVEPIIVASHLFCSLPLRMNFLLKKFIVHIQIINNFFPNIHLK